jgi:Septum formation
MSLMRRCCTAALILPLVSACTSNDHPASELPSPSISTSTARVVPPKPAAKACYQVKLTQLTRPTNQSKPVSCAGRHDAQTIFVGRLRTSAAGHSKAVDSAAVQRHLTTTCSGKFAKFVGGSQDVRSLSRFKVVWFRPTLSQADRGPDWFRCDLIAFAKQNALLRLPPSHALQGVFDKADGLDTYGLCGTAAPGAHGFARVICSQKHTWRAIATIPIAGGKKYPGVAAVRDVGDRTCKSRARQRTGFSLKFSYGWEWPTRKQWADAAQHYGYCWAPG